jgi:hypothetical protein
VPLRPSAAQRRGEGAGGPPIGSHMTEGRCWLRVEGAGLLAGSGGSARQQALAEGAATSGGGLQWERRRGAVFLYRRLRFAGSGGTFTVDQTDTDLG